MAEDNSNTDVFIYTEGAVVPDDVVRVRVHPSVTVIPERAFDYRKKLKEVELCEGLLEIGEMAFMKCDALKRITIPSSVTTVREWSFSSSKLLEEVEMCEGLLEIREAAFSNCEALKYIHIPSTVNHIGKRAFGNCAALKRIKIFSAVKKIGSYAFGGCKELIEVELSDGLQEIGEYAFGGCTSLERIKVPTTVSKINAGAFTDCVSSVYFHDGVKEIESYAVQGGSFPIFRFPPNAKIPRGMWKECKSLFSVEIPHDTSIDSDSEVFHFCHSLRNVVIPLDAIADGSEMGINGLAFINCLNLYDVFGTNEGILKDIKDGAIDALKHRFDNLPIHKMIYYQSYQPVTVGQLINATTILDVGENQTTGKQDCLGMTPLHVLACSTVQNIELYIVLVTKYPEALITKDRWGAIPLLYAIWGNEASNKIVQFLVGSYRSIYPNYVFNWNEMIETLGTANAPSIVMQNLVDLQKKSFPEQSISWDEVLPIMARRYSVCNGSPSVSVSTFKCLVRCSVLDRIDSIGVKQYRDEIRDYIEKFPVIVYDRRVRRDAFASAEVKRRRGFLSDLETKLMCLETGYQRLKEGTTMLELVLWKHSMNQWSIIRQGKRLKEDTSGFRKQCRINCGADVVIEHVLSYLL